MSDSGPSREDQFECQSCGKPHREYPENGKCDKCGYDVGRSRGFGLAADPRFSAEQPPPELQEAKQDKARCLGRIFFLLGEPLGTGGMGTVYKAWDEIGKRVVAVKKLKDLPKPDDRERLLREGKVLLHLHHEGIVQVYMVHNDEHPFVVEEYIEGKHLGDHAKGPQRMTDRECADMCARICDALEYVHRKGISHRDLNPRNIQIRDGATPVVVDFGLAHWEGADLTVTMAGFAAGTSGYVAPERLKNPCPAPEPLADVYGLGGILHYLLCLDDPQALVRDKNPNQADLDLFNGLVRKRPDLQAYLAAICMKAMAHDYRKRYASAAELAADLRLWLQGKRPSATPPGLAERVVCLTTRHPALSVFAVIALLLLAIGIPLFLNQQGKAARRKRARPYVTDAQEALKHADNSLFVKGASLADIREQLHKAQMASDSAIACDPEYAEPWLIKAQASFLENDAEKSEEFATRCLQLDPESLDAHYLRARTRMLKAESIHRYATNALSRAERARHDAAYQEQNRLAKEDLLLLLQAPGNESLKNRARCYYEILLGQPDEAARLVDEALKKDPTGWELFAIKADAWAFRDRGVQEASLVEASRLRPNDATVLRRLGGCQEAGGNAEGALASLERSIECDPDNPDAHGIMGRILWRLCRFDEALPEMNREIRDRPGFTGGYFARGQVNLLLGNKVEAVADLATCLSLIRDDQPGWEYYDDYACALFSSGREKDAVEQLRIAFQRDTEENQQADTNLAVALLRYPANADLVALTTSLVSSSRRPSVIKGAILARLARRFFPDPASSGPELVRALRATGSAKAYMALATRRFWLGDYDGAGTMIPDAIKKGPEGRSAILLTALARSCRGCRDQYAATPADYPEELFAQDDDVAAAARVGLGVVVAMWIRSSKPQWNGRALEVLNGAEARHSDWPEAALALALLHEVLKTNEAGPWWAKAVERDPAAGLLAPK